MINLKKTYIYATILIAVISIVYLFLFLDLYIFFIIPAIVGLVNYYFLENIRNYKEINHLTVLGTLFFRYIVYIVVVFLLIWLNRESIKLIEIGISCAIGFSIIQLSTIINTILNRKEVK